MTASTGLFAALALTVVLLALRLRRQAKYIHALETEHLRVKRERERLELIYLGKRPWVKGWL